MERNTAEIAENGALLMGEHPSARAGGSEPKTVLVMDDNEEIRNLLGAMLRRIGFQPQFAKDGQETIDSVSEAYKHGSPFDCVIVDLTIPDGMGGIETFERLREIDPGVKAIASSGYTSDRVMTHYADYGFKGVLPKPFRLAELSSVMYGLYKHESDYRTQQGTAE